jgi:hypothetical protein
MKKAALILSLALVTSNGFAQLSELQRAFFNSWNDAGIQEFYEKTRSQGHEDAVSQAYKGAASAMYASQVSGITKKLSCFNSGKAAIEAAVRKHPANAEIRFLRFAIQCKAPFILGYSGNLEDDANVIIRSLQSGRETASSVFWTKARAFLMSSGELTGEQEAKLSKMK